MTSIINWLSSDLIRYGYVFLSVLLNGIVTLSASPIENRENLYRLLEMCI